MKISNITNSNLNFGRLHSNVNINIDDMHKVTKELMFKSLLEITKKDH